MKNTFFSSSRNKLATFIISLMLFSFYNVKGQSAGDSRITLKYGALTVPQLSFFTADILATAITGGLYKTENQEATGIGMVGYEYFLTDNLTIGAKFGYEQIKYDLVSNSAPRERLTAKYFTALVGIKYEYVQTDFFRMYSSASTGGLFEKKEASSNVEEDGDSKTYVAYHVSVLGLRLGRKFSGFTELGFGSEGILNFGFSYEF